MTVARLSQSSFYSLRGKSGIGLRLVCAILERSPCAVIFAGARDPTSAYGLNDFSRSNDNIKVLQIIVDDEQSNLRAMEEVKRFTNHLHIVIANAGESIIASLPVFYIHGSSPGISIPAASLHPIDNAVYRDLVNVNTFGPLFLYKAAYSLLIEPRVTDSSLSPPKFFITSTGLASMGDFCKDYVVAPYGMSKAAANYLAVVMHHETRHVNAVIVAYHPGECVWTDLSDSVAEMTLL